MKTSLLCMVLSAAAIPSLASSPPAEPQKRPVWEAPAEAKQLQNPMKGDGRTVERGQKLFDRYCIPCHGTEGAADGKMARKLGYKPANLTLEQMNQMSDGEIFWKISKGRDPMPVFEQQLSQRERWDLVSYVRTLMKNTQ